MSLHCEMLKMPILRLQRNGVAKDGKEEQRQKMWGEIYSHADPVPR